MSDFEYESEFAYDPSDVFGHMQAASSASTSSSSTGRRALGVEHWGNVAAGKLDGSGHLGAKQVAEDLGIQKWWEPTKEMDRYLETYLREE